jgi:hypothetical protein
MRNADGDQAAEGPRQLIVVNKSEPSTFVRLFVEHCEVILSMRNPPNHLPSTVSGGTNAIGEKSPRVELDYCRGLAPIT